MRAMSRYEFRLFLTISSWNDSLCWFMVMGSIFSFYSLGREILATDFADYSYFVLRHFYCKVMLFV